ncbi:hypothetical protein MNB_ARC-1_723 [hydrothermal vent metagenome]|uniref:DNA binding HTH domain-containing protein n=1 Tax=hydrothermal vent metagenome TaxID=652676 RepID=A0A3B1E975_9ZZZZ
MSLNLPVNILIVGQNGVGRKLLANEILSNCDTFYAKQLEELIISKTINLSQYTTLILYNLHEVINKHEFLNNLSSIKIIATTLREDKQYSDKFAVKIHIPPLASRPEDVNALIAFYTQEVKQLYPLATIPKTIDVDLSENGITLKQSIYKKILFSCVDKKEMADILYDFFIKELKNEPTYKQLLSIYEIPLFNAAKSIYKSQLQIAKKLDISRITLRKKMDKYSI